MDLPTGVASLPFRVYDGDGSGRTVVLPCRVEIMMACFTQETCRVRGTLLASAGPYTEGDEFRNKDTGLTLELIDIIRGT